MTSPSRPTRTSFRAAVVRALACLVLLPALGQAQNLVYGGQAGWVSSRQLVQHEDPSETRDGLLAGAFLEVPTPARSLGVMAEGSYVQRGGRFPLSTGPGGDVRADYLVFSVAPVVRYGLGPVALYVYAGPSLEAYLQVRTAAELQGAFREPSDQIFSVQVGGGLETTVIDGWSLRLEARRVEGLSDAFDSTAGQFRHRSHEVAVRIGRSRGR